MSIAGYRWKKMMAYRRNGFAVINFLITLNENNAGF